MAQRLRIANHSHPMLRQRAKPVVSVTNPLLQTLIDNLLHTVAHAQGVGIAAPQVRQPWRLFIVASRPTDRYPNAPLMAPTPMLNPRLLDHSEAKEKDWEGCLSVVGWRGQVPRYREIEVEYGDRWGELHRRTLTGFVARIFQHELDHLEGMLFLDHLESEGDRCTERDYQQLSHG
jgi:peptide deformylase